MHLTVIIGSPRTAQKSNTAKIVKTFLNGFEESENTSETWFISDQTQWEKAKKSYEENEHILIALPLFVESIPGILLEFFERLSSKPKSGTKIAFLLQGGFAEASQLRCCEAYLEKLPSYFNCEYVGTLIKGDNFSISWMPDKTSEKILKPYKEMGKIFAQQECFIKEQVTKFAAPEYFPKPFQIFFRIMTPLQRLMFSRVSKSVGCKEKLNFKPYQDCIQNSRRK